MADKTLSQFIETSKAKWKPSKAKGVEYVALHTDPNEKTGTFLYRIPAGGIFPKHRHISSEEVLVLKGDLKVLDRTLKAGDFLYSPPGSTHEMTTTAGCMFFSSTTKAIEVIPEFVGGDMEVQPDAPPPVVTPQDRALDPREIDPNQISVETTPVTNPEDNNS